MSKEVIPDLDYEAIESWETLIFMYKSALKYMETKIAILNDEFQAIHKYNPIEHVKSRLKTAESIVKKLKRDGREETLENMVRYMNDIAGIRIVCSFTPDIYLIADMIARQEDIGVLSYKDFMKNPKVSGYTSYHMILAVPVYLSDKAVKVKVELQIRTIAQDFWASLEHKMYYKFEGHAPDYIRQELRNCAKMVSELDEKMLPLNQAIHELSKTQIVEKNNKPETSIDSAESEKE